MTLPERFAFGQNEVDGYQCPMAYLGMNPDIEPNMTVAERYDGRARKLATEEEMDGEWCGTLSAEEAEEAWRMATDDLSIEWQHGSFVDIAEEVEHELFG